jgi:hypothetical protein
MLLIILSLLIILTSYGPELGERSWEIDGTGTGTGTGRPGAEP